MSESLADRWHASVCSELEARIKNRDFWLWVVAEPGDEESPPEEVADGDWATAAASVADWLGGMSADMVDPDDPPKHQVSVATTRVEVSATPKKPNRRGSDPLVLNLYPGATYFTGSYSAGPAPQPPDEDDLPDTPGSAQG